MNKVVNLRQFRKHKERMVKSARAEENRTRFGVSKTSKRKTEADTAAIDKTLDNAKIEKPDD